MTRKNSLVMFVGIMVSMAYSMGPSFIVGYGSLLFGILAIGSLSYDEFDNGMPFLMSLPVTRKEYVTEKFMFCGTMMFIGWSISMIICIIFSAVNGEMAQLLNEWQEMVATLMIFLAVVLVLVTLELKFGVEKSRTALMAIGGAVFALAIIAGKMMPETLPAPLAAIDNLPDMVIMGFFVLIALLVVAVSYMVSVKIMEKKQF